MIEVLYRHKDGDTERSFFVVAHKDGSADLHFTQEHRPFIVSLNADEVSQLTASINSALGDTSKEGT